MANNLTGDYEAVLEIRVRMINAILATLHQAQMEKDPPITFPHSASIRVGKPSVAITPQQVRERTLFMQWTSKAVKSLRDTTGSAENARARLSSKAPPGIASMFEQAWDDLDKSAPMRVRGGPGPGAFEPVQLGDDFEKTVLEPVPDSGRVDCQISNPTISIPPGSGSQVRVHVWVRGHFYRDDGTVVPTPAIHGEIRAVYVATPVTLSSGPGLRVQITSDDNQIEFDCKPPLSAANAQTIITHVRAALRKQFVALDVPLPPDFAFSGFKALGSPPDQAVVLPLSSSLSLPAGGLGSVTNYFLASDSLGSEHFAVAVSKEYLQPFFDALRESIRAYIAQIDVPIYTVSLSNLDATWKSGKIDIVGSIHAHTDTPAPDDDITFTQSLKLVLGAAQAVSVEADGDPFVSSGWLPVEDFAAAAIKNARDSALPKASASLTATLTGARNKLVSALRKFDESGSAEFTKLDVTADGIVVRGTIKTRSRLDPVVSYGDVDNGKSVSAGPSWIPGGRIDTFSWSWVTTDNPIPWENRTDSDEVDGRFIWKKSPGAIAYGSVCLEIRGKRVNSEGFEETVPGAGTVCANQSSGPPWAVFPPEWVELFFPFWLPYPPYDVFVKELLAGHINVVHDDPAPGRITRNVLVHFTGPLRNRPLQELGRAVAMMRRRDASLLTVMVLPTGTFDGRRSEIEERLGPPGERFGAELVLTEDDVGGWSRTFAAPDGPSTHLMNARAEYVWKRDGELDAGTVARALDEHALPAPPPERVPLRLGVEPGTRARDTVFTDERGDHTSLRRLRGRRVLLVFWQSWSAPCIRELRRLEQARTERGAPFVLAVNGGEDHEVLAEVRRAYGLSFPLINDADRLIAALYGIRCWPTTVSINEVGIVDRVQLGLAHATRERAAVGAADAPART